MARAIAISLPICQQGGEGVSLRDRAREGVIHPLGLKKLANVGVVVLVVMVVRVLTGVVWFVVWTVEQILHLV